MNNDILEGNWVELKGKIKSQWGKLTDDEIETTKGNMEQLTGRIQKTYGYAKEKAVEEFDKFKQSLARKVNSSVFEDAPKNVQ